MLGRVILYPVLVGAGYLYLWIRNRGKRSFVEIRQNYREIHLEGVRAIQVLIALVFVALVLALIGATLYSVIVHGVAKP